ncbi:MAG: tetratricopeptide repeat protein [Streptosporangiaceae bacterium]
MPGAVLADKLTGHLVREIMLRGSGGGPLTPLADQFNHDLTHLQLARLVALDVTAPAPSAGAGGSAREVGPARPAGAVRVSEAEPRRLGVHAAISVPGAPDETPPEYVPRDADADEHGVRATVAAAAQRGGFVLLVGGSSVGKTRCAVEAVQALLPDWWLVHPAGPAEVVALAAAQPARMVVWLDELQRYLDGERGLTGGVVRALLGAPDPAVIIGTLWPDRYTVYAAVPAPGGADLHAREREVLDLAAVIRISPAFSAAEQDRARSAAVRDPRLQVALGAAGYGLTQTLAAAPQLVARWEDAQTAEPYAWAVLTAALDAARLGARAPLSIDFLRAAAPGYCTSQQQAEAPENWFERALAYATGKLYGAAAALSPAGAGMGQIAGYTAADYLIQYSSRERRYERVPASTWDAALGHVRDPADIARLADSARNRLLYRYAIPLYRQAADAGDDSAALWLTLLLAQRGDLDGLRTRADAGDGVAALHLADLLAERGDLDQAEQILRAQADAGDRDAAGRLAELLEKRGDLDQAEQILRAQADAGEWGAAWRLARLLAERGDLDGLRTRADAGDQDAAGRLAELLEKRGDLDGLRTRADAGDRDAAGRLAELLEKRGDLDQAEQILRAQADAGEWGAAGRLARLLAERGDLDQAEQILRAQADAGDQDAAGRLADLLEKRGDLDQAEQILRAQADQAEQILRAQADAGDQDAAWRLSDLLAQRGDLDGLRTRADAGDQDAAGWLARLLAERGDLDGLRTRADAGDRAAAGRLAHLLAQRGDLDGLRAQAAAGSEYLVGQLADLLLEQGRGEEAERLRRFGLNLDGSIACE